MPRLDYIPAVARNKILMKPVEFNHDSPWTPLARPLSESKVALVTSAGVHLRADEPFGHTDPSYRVLPADVTQADILLSHSSLGFDRAAILQDINVVFPLDRMRELHAAGTVGELATNYYSFMGAQSDVSIIKDKTSWEVAELLKQDGVNVVLLSPTCPFCTHTVGTIARNLEQSGLTTVSFSLVREHTEKLKPPRALFVPFPFGMPVGRPERPDEQLAVLHDAFRLLEASSGPVLSDYPEPEDVAEMLGSPVQASAVTDDSPVLDLALEVSMTRRYWEQWLAAKGHTAVGLSRIPPAKFRGVVRYLEAYLDGGEPRPPVQTDRSTPILVRHCVQDIRSMYLEARMFTHPNESSRERQTWFWSETAFASFLRRLRAYMAESKDDETVEAAAGIAR